MGVPETFPSTGLLSSTSAISAMPQPSSSPETNYIESFQESATFSPVLIPKAKWHEKLSAIKENSYQIANDLSIQGHRLVPKILGPREILCEDTVPLAIAIIEFDWRTSVRLKMVKCAIELISDAYVVNSLDSALPVVLASIIEGKGLYEHGIGEFFLLYGKFEQKFCTGNGRATRDKMVELIKDDESKMKLYTEGGKNKKVPLPYAVRNILAHQGTNPNKLDDKGEDIKKSIDLLRDWVKRKPN